MENYLQMGYRSGHCRSRALPGLGYTHPTARALYTTAGNSTACKNWGERQWFWQQLGLTAALFNARVLPQSYSLSLSRTQGRSRVRDSRAGADREAGVISEGLRRSHHPGQRSKRMGKGKKKKKKKKRKRKSNPPSLSSTVCTDLRAVLAEQGREGPQKREKCWHWDCSSGRQSISGETRAISFGWGKTEETNPTDSHLLQEHGHRRAEWARDKKTCTAAAISTSSQAKPALAQGESCLCNNIP